MTNLSICIWPVLIGVLFFFPGPIASILANRYGHRAIMIVGGFMSAVGILMSSFATDIYYLYFSYGIITGKSKEDVCMVKGEAICFDSRLGGSFIL